MEKNMGASSNMDKGKSVIQEPAPPLPSDGLDAHVPLLPLPSDGLHALVPLSPLPSDGGLRAHVPLPQVLPPQVLLYLLIVLKQALMIAFVYHLPP